MEKGKLYRVNDYALSNKAECAMSNRRVVKDHGYIWIYEGRNLSKDDEGDDEDAEPYLRSVATGYIQWFYLDELEAADEEG